MNGLRNSGVTDGYALGVTILVALTALSAIGLHEKCHLMLRSPDCPERWEAPGIPDATAGDWPQGVVRRLLALAVGLSLERFKADRITVKEASAELEAIVVEGMHRPLPSPPIADGSATPVRHTPSLPAPRQCTVCLDNDREVRFECGHCVM